MNNPRADVDTALLAQIQGAFNWQVPASMHFQQWGSVDSGNQPCAFLRRIAEEVSQTKGYRSNRYVLHYELWIYCRVDHTDITSNPYATFDVIIDAIDSTLLGNPALGHNTLSGLVDSCRLAGQILIADGVDDGQSVIRIPIDVFTGV